MAGESDDNREHRGGPVVQTGLILGQSFGVKPVQYAVVDGLALFEGDIVLGTEEEVRSRTEELRAISRGEIVSGVAITGAQFRWPGCRVPYEIDPALTNQNRVTDAIAHWEANTNFRFVLRTAANQAAHPDYVTFRPGGGCSSSVGRRGGQQFVNLGNGCTTGNTIHEIGHVIGLWHEQSREDRDSFVTIQWASIQAGMEHNFNQHITDGDDIGAYDYGSIMHYPRNAFSIDGSDTITPLDPTATIGQRTALSAGDIAAANSLCQAQKALETIKEGTKDIRFDTRKETAKDVRLDTLKEQLSDTRKEAALDTIKEQTVDTLKERKEGAFDTLKEAARDTSKEAAFDTRKEASVDPIGPLPGSVQPGMPRLAGDRPFVLATPHQAHAAGAQQIGSVAAVALALDQQLQQLATMLARVESEREGIQRQYDEAAAVLQQALDALDQGAS